jgi:hypothetical protein
MKSESIQQLTEHPRQLAVERDWEQFHSPKNLADALIYLVRLADQLDIDLLDAADRKLAVNEAKYPAERVRGSSRKYSEYK